MSPTSIEGHIPFTVQGETHQTWYKLFGDLANRTHRPLVVLHGGPGLSHDYLLPIADLANTSTPVPVIFYDQIGSARGTHLPDKPHDFWTIDLFIDELVNLLKYFGIEDDFDLLGHSWGGIFGSEFAVRRQPAGLKHLIVSNSLTSMALWGQSTMQLASKFPEWILEGLKGGMSDPDKYRKALIPFYEVHACTVEPTPAEVTFSLQQAFEDPTVANNMFARVLATWTITERLHEIRVPTLVINGVADIAQDFVVEGFFRNIAKVKWVTFAKSSHMPFWEERERYMTIIRDFTA